MADTFQLQVATPEHLFVDQQVASAQLPGKAGYMGILPDHAPLLSALAPGVLTYGSGEGEEVLAIDGGFVEVFENQVRVLADHAERAADIQVDEARRQLAEAEQKSKQLMGETNSKVALRDMAKAQARIDAAEHAAGRLR